MKTFNHTSEDIEKEIKQLTSKFVMTIIIIGCLALGFITGALVTKFLLTI